MTTSQGEVEIDVPRDRKSEFEPKAISAFEKRDSRLEQQIIGMYARGMSVRDIQSQLEEYYGVEMSPALISKITDNLLEGIHA